MRAVDLNNPWRTIREKPRKNHTDYLCYMDYEDYHKANNYKVVYYGDGWYEPYVKYWMPIPKLPEVTIQNPQ